MLKRKLCGFTLIELMIVVAIIGILASVAYPSYTDYVYRSNRSEAQQQLMRIASLQEQYYIDNREYASDMKKLGLGVDPYITDSKNYKIDATVDGASFDLKATAQGSQKDNDTSCLTFELDETGKKSPSPASSDCWVH